MLEDACDQETHRDVVVAAPVAVVAVVVAAPGGWGWAGEGGGIALLQLKR